MHFSTRCIARILLGVLLSSLPAGAWAAPARPLQMAVVSVVPRPRTLAPPLVEIELRSETPELLEGELALSVYIGKRLAHEFRSGEIALAGGAQRFRVMFPPLSMYNEQTPVTVYGRFLTARGEIDLGEHDLVVVARWKRSLAVVFAQPDERAIFRESGNLAYGLELEQFNADPALRPDLITYAEALAPGRFPATAAACTALDLVVLEEDGFAQLSEGQLAAIGDWVEAGGTCCVRPESAPTPAHIAFLNRMAGASPDQPVYSSEEGGRLRIGNGGAPRVARYRPGMGRAAIVHERLDPEADFASLEWRETVCFLWKVRAGQRAPIEGSGVWEFKRPPIGSGGGPRAFEPVSEPGESRLREMLLPERVEGVPLPVVVAILAVFLLAIAPGDWYLLGWLNCRRYTWIYLAVVSLGFTAWMVSVADRYVGNTDFRRALVFVDLARDRIARTSRFELLFTAEQRMVETPVSDALLVPVVDPGAEPQSPGRPYRYQFAWEEEDDASPATAAGDIPVYSGRMPGLYAVRQQMRQWSPVITRQTSFAGEHALPAIDWNRLDPAAWHDAAGRAALREAVARAEPQAHVLLLAGAVGYDLAEEEGGAVFHVDGAAATLRKPLEPVVDLVCAASIRQASGFFDIVSQISPTGGSGFEDLAVVDSSDDGTWLLVVIVPRGDDVLVFRRLYPGAG